MPVYINGREIVVQPRGGDSFHLPHGHSIEFTTDQHHVILAAGDMSSLFELRGTSDAHPGELTVLLDDLVGRVGPGSAGDRVPKPTGYPLPTIDEEIHRLESRCRDAGGDWSRIGAWAAGDTHDGYVRRIRGEIRTVEARGAIST
jgi:hypothetical protein